MKFRLLFALSLTNVLSSVKLCVLDWNVCISVLESFPVRQRGDEGGLD